MAKEMEEQIKRKSKECYGGIGRVYCPYLNDTVVFNAKGLHHVTFKGNGEKRTQAEQLRRLQYMKHAPEILAKSHTLQDYAAKDDVVDEAGNPRKTVKYFAFVAMVKDGGDYKKLKIVVRQIGGGKKHFWSIIPKRSRTKSRQSSNTGFGVRVRRCR